MIDTVLESSKHSRLMVIIPEREDRFASSKRFDFFPLYNFAQSMQVRL